jgi:hypothetical protein
MNTWVKVGLGLGAVVAAVVGVAFLGKKHNDEAEYVTVEVDENCDSDSDEEEAE